MPARWCGCRTSRATWAPGTSPANRLAEDPAGTRLLCVSRPESASPATGSRQIHLQEQTQLLNATFASADAIEMLTG